ncbi:MAG TPA: zinc-ribbon domain-containing protein [Roseovarius sp.]
MRLTCPNCGAQYEVPDDVIPQAGRDVQCSNCGDTWFQTHRDHSAPEDDGPVAAENPEEITPEPDQSEREPAPDEPVSEPAPDTPEPATDEPASLPEPEAEPEEHDPEPEPDTPEPEPESAETVAETPQTVPEIAQSGDPEDTSEAVPATPDPAERPGRREIDPAVANVLREEAEREKRARAAAQGGGLETQPDLGLQDTQDDDRHSRAARARRTHLPVDDSNNPASQALEPQASDPPASDSEAVEPASHRGLFPDIEEINSSLAPGSAGGRTGPDQIAYPEGSVRRGAFRRGFLVAVLIAVAALLVYVFAPQLADMVPALRGVLGEYVSWVNGLRQWLDGQITDLMLWLDSMSSTAPAASGDPASD